MLRLVLPSTATEARVRKHLPWLLSSLPAAVVVSVNLQPEHKAVLEGERELLLHGDTLTITHTGVPEAIGGRGIASHLVEAAFAHARSAGLKVRPACSYAAAWVERHPEVTDLLG